MQNACFMLRRSQTSHELASAKVQEKQRPDGTLLKNDRSNLENLAFRTEMIQMQKENDTCRKVSGGDGRVFPLLRLSGLSLWLAPGIPEGGDVKGVVLNIIYHLIEPAHDNAAVGLFTMNEKGVYLAHRRHVGK